MIAAFRRAWAQIDADWTGDRPASDAALTALLCASAVAVALAGGLSGAERVPAAVTAALGDLAPGLWWAGVVALSFAAPALVARATGEDARSLGLGFGSLRRDLPIYAVAIAVCLPFVANASGETANQALYPMCAGARGGGMGLAAWWLAYGLQFVALEVLFRGVLLVPLARRFGAMAVPLGVVPYVMLHLVWDKPVAEAISAVPFAIFLGIMALRSRSIWGCAVLHVVCAFTMDAGVLWRAGAL